MRIRTRTLPLLTAGAVLLAACDTDDPDVGDDTTDEVEDTDEDTDDLTDDEGVEDDGAEDEGAADDATEDEDAAAEGDAAATADGPVLATAEAELGTHLVTGEGMTVYVHALDEPGEPVCAGDCLSVWNPVPAPDGDVEVDEGVDADLVGSLEREDGGLEEGFEQLTYDEQPLYVFVADAEGQATGQEVNQTWFVVGPDGEAIGGVPDDDELDELDTSDVEDA